MKRSSSRPVLASLVLPFVLLLCLFVGIPHSLPSLWSQSTPTPAMQPIASALPSIPVAYRLYAFLAGVLGAVALYVAQHLDDRIKTAVNNRQYSLLVELVLFSIAGGLTGAFIVDYRTGFEKEAFLIGSTWQGFVSAVRNPQRGKPDASGAENEVTDV